MFSLPPINPIQNIQDKVDYVKKSIRFVFEVSTSVADATEHR